MAAQKSSWLGETARTMVFAVLIAVGVRTFAYEPFNIPSGSMIPTLLIGDYLFVSKPSYGYSRYSLPFALPAFEGRVWFEQPERGDVAVFKLPTDNSTDYIKRIIGLPGDRIAVYGGILHINGEPVRRERIADYIDERPDGDFAQYVQYLETLPNGVRHPIIERGDTEAMDETEEYVVPAGHYFMMGDNRDNSQDSRVLGRVGYVPVENLVGRAEFLFFSTDGGAELWEFWKWPLATRFGRLFNAVN